MASIPPPQDEWIDTYQKLLPHWQSLALSHQVSLI